jgi:proteasome activator subunit 4
MKYWSWVEKSPSWDLHFFRLLSTVAKDSFGKIDWSPYTKQIFTKILQSLELPISGKKSKYDYFPQDSLALYTTVNECKYTIPLKVGQLVIWMLESSKDDNTFTYLENLIQSVENFYQPSNGGAYSSALGILMHNLAKTLAKRKLFDQNKNITTISESLTEKIINLLIPVAKLGLFSKNRSLMYCSLLTFKHFSFILPNETFKSIIELIDHALQTLTETHQTSTIIQLLSYIIHPLLKSNNKEFKDLLHVYMNFTLNGIDSNDFVKTISTMSFFYNFLLSIPILEEPKSSDENTPQAVFYFEEWSLLFLERILTLFEKLGTGKKLDQLENYSFFVISVRFYCKNRFL